MSAVTSTPDSSSSSLWSHSRPEQSSSVATSRSASPESAGTERLASIRLPYHLPPPPTPMGEVCLKDLVVDESIEGLPLGFVVAKMKELGLILLEASKNTVLEFPPTPTLPAFLSCTLHNTQHPSGVSLNPTHILAITSKDSPRILVLPVHGLLYASYSPILSILSSHPNFQHAYPYLPSNPCISPPGYYATALPVVAISIPSATAFTLLHSYIYLNSPSHLLSSLLPSPPSISTPSETCILTPTNPSLRLASLPMAVLLAKVKLVNGFWQLLCALEISDEVIWNVMRRAWTILVGALLLASQSEKRKVEIEGEGNRGSLNESE